MATPRGRTSCGACSSAPTDKSIFCLTAKTRATTCTWSGNRFARRIDSRCGRRPRVEYTLTEIQTTPRLEQGAALPRLESTQMSHQSEAVLSSTLHLADCALQLPSRSSWRILQSAVHAQVYIHGVDARAGAGGAVHGVYQLQLQDILPDQGAVRGALLYLRNAAPLPCPSADPERNTLCEVTSKLGATAAT